MSEAIELATTGLLMGIIHVLTGPDHLSALATLSGTNIRSGNGYVESFLLGIKWGLGHAIGLIVVGAVLISIEMTVNEALSTVMESFVGVFMVALGIYGMHKAFKHRSSVMPFSLSMSQFRYPSNENLHKIAERHDEDYEDNANARSSILCEMTRVLDEDSLHSSLHGRKSLNGSARVGSEEDIAEDDEDVESRIFKAARAIGLGRMTESTKGLGISVMTVPLNRLTSSMKSTSSENSAGSKPLTKSPSHLLLEKHQELLEEFGGTGSSKAEHTDADIVPARSSCTTGALAVLTGLVHGVAGPGGVLGIIPAVQLRDPYLSSVYLGTFCFTSCLVMGGFAAFYGSFSKWLAGGGDGSTNRVFLVEVGSASLSIFVGLIWIVLLSVGKLEDIFP
jgi:hypothetical protein